MRPSSTDALSRQNGERPWHAMRRDTVGGEFEANIGVAEISETHTPVQHLCPRDFKNPPPTRVVARMYMCSQWHPSIEDKIHMSQMVSGRYLRHIVCYTSRTRALMASRGSPAHEAVRVRSGSDRFPPPVSYERIGNLTGRERHFVTRSFCFAVMILSISSASRYLVLRAAKLQQSCEVR